MGATPTVVQKKRKLAEVVTSPDFIDKQKEKEERLAKRPAKPAVTKEPPRKKSEKSGVATAKKAGRKHSSGSETSDDGAFSTHDSTSDPDVPHPPKNASDVKPHLRFTWNALKPPVSEDSLKGKCFALVYFNEEKKKPVLFFGRLLRRFLAEEGGLPENFEFDCFDFTPQPGSIFKKPSTKDVIFFAPWDIIDGPIEVEAYKNGSVKVPQIEVINQGCVRLRHTC